MKRASRCRRAEERGGGREERDEGGVG